MSGAWPMIYVAAYRNNHATTGKGNEMKSYAELEDYKVVAELVLMFSLFKWQQTAPSPGQFATKGDTFMENSQQARLQYLLQRVAVLNPNHIYQTISVHARRVDGESPISTKSNWMKQPLQLNERWFLEACISLPQKKTIVAQLKWVGISSRMIACGEDFVAGETIASYLPPEFIALCENAAEAKLPFPTMKSFSFAECEAR